jgi:chromate transporter
MITPSTVRRSLNRWQFPSGLLILFLVFLNISAVLYGSGYVLLAFLQRDWVTQLG